MIRLSRSPRLSVYRQPHVTSVEFCLDAPTFPESASSPLQVCGAVQFPRRVQRIEHYQFIMQQPWMRRLPPGVAEVRYLVPSGFTRRHSHSDCCLRTYMISGGEGSSWGHWSHTDIWPVLQMTSTILIERLSVFDL
jgi:hypothetical protein